MKSNRRVVVTSTSFSQSKLLIAELQALGLEVFLNSEGRKLSGNDLVSFLNHSKADVAIVGLEPIDAAVLNQCPQLKFVSKYGVGLDNLDLDELRKREIGIGWTAGVNKRSVSELVLAFTLGHLRNVIPSLCKMREGVWKKQGGMQLSEKVFGIVGFGNVGQDLAHLLQPFGCHVVYTDIVDRSAEATRLGAKLVSYDELLKTADIISFHVPSTQLTRNMFSHSELTRVRPSTFVINTARGDIVDFETVCQAVSESRLSGFASDVYPDEPADVSRWKDHPYLYFTPHIGGNAQEAVLAMGRSAISHVANFVKAIEE